MKNSARLDYLLECFRTAREELLSRVRHRDQWLKLQLFAQVIILALAGGLKVGGVEASGPIPSIVALAIPSSYILATPYFVEDRLVGYLSRYVGNLSLQEAKLSSSSEIIYNWDVSEELRMYASHTRLFRGIAQFVAFAITPAGLAITRFVTFGNPWTIFQYIEIIFNVALWFATIWLIFQAHLLRRKTGQIVKK